MVLLTFSLLGLQYVFSPHFHFFDNVFSCSQSKDGNRYVRA